MTLTSSVITYGQKQKRQNEMICIFLMDVMLSEHHITRFAVWNQTGLVRNGRIGMVTVKQTLQDSVSMKLQVPTLTWCTTMWS